LALSSAPAGKNCGDGEPEFHPAVPSPEHQLVNHLGSAPPDYSAVGEWLQKSLVNGVTVRGDCMSVWL